MNATQQNTTLDSIKKSLKYVKNVKITVLANTWTSFSHGLNWTPMCWAWTEDNDGWYMKGSTALFYPASTSTGTPISVLCYSTSSAIFVKCDKAGDIYVEYLYDRGLNDTGEKVTSNEFGISITGEGTDAFWGSEYLNTYLSASTAYKIASRGSETISWAVDENGWKYIDIPHGLGYKPKAIVFESGTGTEIPNHVSVGYSGNEIGMWYVNDTYLRIVGYRDMSPDPIDGVIPSGVIAVDYTIFLDEITDTDFI